MNRWLFILVFFLTIQQGPDAGALQIPGGVPENPEIIVLDEKTFVVRFYSSYYLLKIEAGRIVVKDSNQVYRVRHKVGPGQDNITIFKRLNIKKN